MPHKPVLLQEVLDCLSLKEGHIVLDGTLGNGGHALEILKRIGPEGRLIGLDQDPASLKRAKETLKEFSNVSFHEENFRNAQKVLEKTQTPFADAVILDVGFSSEQIEDAGRGFSFDRPGPLDMRMNPKMTYTAKDYVNEFSETELKELFWKYGNERFAPRFARAIVHERSLQPIETTQDLVRTIEGALPKGAVFSQGHRPPWARRHPATRVFQALRIAVNDELGALSEGLPKLWGTLRPGGRMAVISFHSLEDRVVKNSFRGWVRAGEGRGVTKKPIVASEEEQSLNPRARSAKLRAVEKQ